MSTEEKKYNINDVLISVAGIIAVAVFLYVTGLFHDAFIMFALIFILLLPFRKNKVVNHLILLSVLIFVIWFLNSLSGVLTPLIFAMIFSYALNPLVEKLIQKGLSRTIASLLILLSFFIIVAVLIITLSPIIIQQFSDLIKSLPSAVNSVSEWIQSSVIPWLKSLGISETVLDEKLKQELPTRLEQILSNLLNGISSIVSGVGVILTQLVNLILIPFLTFYLLKDYDKLKEIVKKIIPANSKKTVLEYYHKIDRILSSYIRGAIFSAVIHGIGVFIFLSILGVKYAIFLGAISALLNLIPYFGLLVAITLASITALFSGNPGMQVPLVIIIYLLQNLLETSYIVPKVVGKQIGLHPAVLIISLFVFAYFFGFVGMLIALPVTGILIMLFEDWLEKRKE